MTIQTSQDLMREFGRRARDLQLAVDCPMSGPLNSQVVIISDYPGSQEANSKRPMTGGAGRFLWTCLQKHGINRTNVYVTNVCKRQLHFSKGDVRKALNADELHAWTTLLTWELAQLPDVRLIIALGALPLYFFQREDGINKWRGSVVHQGIIGPDGLSKLTPILYGNNPAAVIRQPREELMFRFNLAKAELILQGKYKDHEINATINPSFDEAMRAIEQLRDEARNTNATPIAYDIECISNETACVGFASSANAGICINFRSREANRYSLQEDAALYLALQNLFSDHAVRFVAQNGNFDAYWLWYKDRIRVHRNWFDTLLAHHALYPTLPHDLGALTSQYTTHPYYKDQSKEWREGGDIDSFWRYNVKDACITWEVHRRLVRELEREGMGDFFYNHVMRIQPHLTAMTVTGVLSDRILKERITEETSIRVNELLATFQKQAQRLTHDPEYYPNPGSWQQMQKLYFHRLKLVGRGTSTDAANRERIASNPHTSDEARDMLATVNEYAKESKFLGTYAESRIDDDGRFRCEYKQYGTQEAPGRLSSAAVLWGTGGNLQNQPERAKGMFIADHGYCFVYFDLSQAEARFVGWDAKIEKWKEQFERARVDSSYDCHCALAADLWNIPYDDVPTKDKDEDDKPTLRFVAKRCRHGLNYRMGADRLQQTTGLPMSKAVEAYNIYHEKTPELRRWWEELARVATKDKVLTTPYGRRLLILERVTDESLRSIVAFRPQSTIGDKVSQVIYQSHEDSGWPIDARIVLNVHDALIALVPIAKAKHCLRIMKHYAEQPIIVQGEQLIIPAECAMSEPDEHGTHRWSTLKKLATEVLES